LLAGSRQAAVDDFDPRGSYTPSDKLFPPPLTVCKYGIDMSKRPLIQQWKWLSGSSASHDDDFSESLLKKPSVAIGYSTHAQYDVGFQSTDFSE
jgi:hypothetical protein